MRKRTIIAVLLLVCIVALAFATKSSLISYINTTKIGINVDCHIPEVFTYNREAEILTLNIQNLSKDDVKMVVYLKPFLTEESYEILPNTTLGDIKTQLLKSELPQTIEYKILYFIKDSGDLLTAENRTAIVKEF